LITSGLLACGTLLAGGEGDEQAGSEAAQAKYRQMLEEAERARSEAETARREAMKVAELARETAELERQYALEQEQKARKESEEMKHERAARVQEMDKARDELSKAHRELREASREVAKAHRELARSREIRHTVRVVNLGDRAVIGLVMGKSTDQGVEVMGVSPDGPAERAGIKAGDIMVSIRGEDLSESGKPGRARVGEVMSEVSAGEEVSVSVLRDGEPWQFAVVAEKREPSSWQSLIRIPEAGPIEGIDGEAHVIVERIEVPEVDTEALELHLAELKDKLSGEEFRFAYSNGGDFEFNGDFDIEVDDFSGLASQALREANIWFGMPHSQGLELTAVNEGLGKYFKTDRGVLVIRAREDNAYQLESGDVILKVGAMAVDTPADVIRALRELEPGNEIEFEIKRDRKDRTLKAVMPENRLGFLNSFSH
jgi:C-terminal processing protease CtpA/Prc